MPSITLLAAQKAAIEAALVKAPFRTVADHKTGRTMLGYETPDQWSKFQIDLWKRMQKSARDGYV